MKRKGKYITTNILLACLSKPRSMKKDIYTQLAETIKQRRKIMEQWENLLAPKPADTKKDIHAQLEETIAELRKVMQQSGKLVSPAQDQSFVMHDKKAA